MNDIGAQYPAAGVVNTEGGRVRRFWLLSLLLLAACAGAPVVPAAVVPSPTPSISPSPEVSEPVEVYYANCAAARSAGVAPIHRGEPGYRRALDRDGDGVACDK